MKEHNCSGVVFVARYIDAELCDFVCFVLCFDRGVVEIYITNTKSRKKLYNGRDESIARKICGD